MTESLLKAGQAGVLQSVLPVADRSGVIDTGRANWPNGVSQVLVQLDVTPFAGLAHPFNDPALMLTFGLWISYAQQPSSDFTDWQQIMGGIWNGSPTGVWGKGQANPEQSWTNTGAEPKWYRGVIAPGVGQTITYGVSALTQ